ncbi:hypothetical protein EFV37_29150 [Mesorhizobium loti]|uniref:Uncharacterized protein n=1 Tax=Mesorhizobium jarvisii TaxID=1777867 RepID=A0A6M7TLP5_9HYPH|nr:MULTISPECIES: phage tail protein [Mesorhizobium]OBQ68906.1 hypothetical protein A9K72_12000 [Mesorhizobium loti]QKC65871.1 hypothetical protein EB229_29140 [Mesorhizobium jarvisii]QKD11785.1 hypothetical protein EFV37_29150 [Mesorhizobium loti]RJT37891.1 hypothetical protein D3242_01195 [Mesorhizobium jarvisii]
MGIKRPILYIGGPPPATPTVADVPPFQATLPTSAYGQTIPVIWGLARLPAAYIWCAPILTITSTHQEFWDTVTTTTTGLTARLRFARPLVPDSQWSIRKLYANGKLIWDGTTGYRADGLNFRFYDGRSTQGRDPAMVSEEGEANVSAHRGYLDIVVQDYDVFGFGSPPVFEAEFVQALGDAVSVQNFVGFSSDPVDTVAAGDWESNTWYGFSNNSGMIRRFSTGFLREIYAIPVSGLGRAYSTIVEDYFRYFPNIDRLIGFGFVPGISGGTYPILFNPVTGVAISEGLDIGGTGQLLNAAGAFQIGSAGVLIVGSYHLGYVSLFTFNASSIVRVSLSGASWDGRGVPESISIGDIRADNADVWVCVGTVLYKAVVNALGQVLSITSFATFAHNLRYAVFYNDDVIVWDDNAQAIRIDGATGATVWTVSVPYQIEVAQSRRLGTADASNLNDTLFFQSGVSYYFTSLIDGTTRTVSNADVSSGRYVYDADSSIAITTDNTVPQRRQFDVAGSGSLRNLSDFLEALMAAGGFEPAQIETINVDDQVQGAVIDVTAGVRDIARATCEPYSIAIFERSGVIIFKRALTDASFAVDLTLSSSGDIADSGGQAIKARRLNPEEFVSRYGINYRDPDQIYQTRAQFGEIPTLPLPVAPADWSVKADIPIIADADTIKTLATQKVNRMAIERHEFTMTLRAKYGDVEPEDIARFIFANRLITARITETTVRPDYLLDVLATEFLSSVSVSISGAVGRPIEPEPIGTPASRYYHLDIPLLSDSHDLAGSGLVQYHVLASAGQPYWDGATLYRKDSSGTYQAVAGQTTNGIVGVALGILPNWDIPYATEFTRTLNVAFISGDPTTLTSATYLEMVNGANFFAIGQPGRWEVCQVMSITVNANGTYTFEGLRRGRKSSEEYTALHAIGDYVVWLSEENVQRIDYTIASLDDAFDFKPVGLGGNINNTPSVNRTVTGEAEKIPKPCNLKASIGSPSDVRLSWVRRSRIGSFWADDGEDAYTAPLGETLEQFIVRIKSGPAGTVLRTVTVNNATLYDYPGNLQTTDFGSPLTTGSNLTFDVRQVSGTGVICPTRETTVTL